MQNIVLQTRFLLHGCQLPPHQKRCSTSALLLACMQGGAACCSVCVSLTFIRTDENAGIEVCAALAVVPFHPCLCLLIDVQGLSRPGSSAGSSKKQPKQAAGAMDVWTMLDMLDAANALLWTDLVRPGECKWHCCIVWWHVRVGVGESEQGNMPAVAASTLAAL
jgi:hypothetical protein